jgi:hypothetical protein
MNTIDHLKSCGWIEENGIWRNELYKHGKRTLAFTYEQVLKIEGLQ